MAFLGLAPGSCTFDTNELGHGTDPTGSAVWSSIHEGFEREVYLVVTLEWVAARRCVRDGLRCALPG
jgi:hypothetical protein